MASTLPKTRTNRFVVDHERAHIEVGNQDVCRDTCAGRYCTTFCPAHVFAWDEKKAATTVEYASCLECGACVIGCPYDNIIALAPRGGFGVAFDFA